jgi:type IV fimbrial biogenesis protein FimT
MIALAIAGLLLVLAAPSYSTWIADSQIRSAAESIAGGLRYVQAEAIKRNESIEFVLDPTIGTGGWSARLVSAPSTPLQGATFLEGASRTQFARTPTTATTVTFDGLGTIAGVNADGSPVLTQVDIASTGGNPATHRNLTVLVGGGRTGIKICDPKWTAVNPNDPKACPP